MKKNSWDSPRRQTPLALALIFTQSLRRMLSGLWPIFLVIFLGRGDRSDVILLFVAIVSILGSLALSVVAYFNFYYHVEDDQLIINQGVLRKNFQSIPIERIQSIDFEQSLLHQVLNLFRVKIDTAGSDASEASITALKKEEAEELRSFILRLKREVKPGKELEKEDDLDEFVEEEQKSGFYKLSVLDLIKVGVSRNHLQTAGILTGIAFGFLDDIEQILGLQVFETIQSEALSGRMGVIGFLSLFVVFLAIAFFWTLGRTVLRHYNFTLLFNSQSWSTRSGLFERLQRTASRKKVQQIIRRDNPLARVFGMSDVSMTVASSAGDSSTSNLSMPGFPTARFQELIREQFGYTPGLYKPIVISSKMIERYSLIWLVIFILLDFGLYWLQMNAFLAMALIMTVVGVFWIRAYYRSWTLSYNEDTIHISYGVWTRVERKFELYKLQAVEWRETPYDRRNGLKSLLLHTASGSIRIPFLSQHDAEFLGNFLLEKVERSRKAWM